jgi:NAD+ kinase
MHPLKSIAFVVNQNKPDAPSIAENLIAIAKTEGLKTILFTHYPLPDNALQDCDVCCVVGGDGTLLGVVLQALAHSTPVFGVNCGKLGFLSSLSPESAHEQFHQLIKGTYKISPRSLLRCGEKYALNDIVIKQRHSSRLMHIRLSYENTFINETVCDGIIVSTPTGSTAYNLSAGGPIIHWASQVIVVTPICPHTLSNRSLVLDNQGTLQVDIIDDHSLPAISIDGQPAFQNAPPKSLSISPSPQKLLLLQPPHLDYFTLLRNKLDW